jgi:hypothetical protein
MQGIRKESQPGRSSVIESTPNAHSDNPANVPYAGHLTLEDMAWCADVAAPRLRGWAAAGRLKRDAPFTAHDAVEAAVAFSLPRRGVSQKAAPAAWQEIRPQLRKLLLAGADKPWAVISADGPLAEALPDAASAADAAARLGKCWVFPLGAVIEAARERYALLGAQLDPKAGELAPIRQAKPSG